MTAADRKVVDVNNEHILSMLRKMLAREGKKFGRKSFLLPRHWQGKQAGKHTREKFYRVAQAVTRYKYTYKIDILTTYYKSQQPYTYTRKLLFIHLTKRQTT